MSSQIKRVDLHTEISPSGAPVIVAHNVAQVPVPTQSVVCVKGERVLRKGDRFRCGHVPAIGPFQTPPPNGSGEGSLSAAGQNIVRISGIPVATMAGKNRSCSDGITELPNSASVRNSHPTIVTISGKPVLLG